MRLLQLAQLPIKNIRFYSRHKHGWKLSWGLLENTQWCDGSECLNSPGALIKKNVWWFHTQILKHSLVVTGLLAFVLGCPLAFRSTTIRHVSGLQKCDPATFYFADWAGIHQLNWLYLLLGNARSLKHLCRLQIRDHLSRLRLRAPVFINFLPLPPRLKDYLRYKEFDVYGRGSIVNPLWKPRQLITDAPVIAGH